MRGQEAEALSVSQYSYKSCGCFSIARHDFACQSPPRHTALVHPEHINMSHPAYQHIRSAHQVPGRQIRTSSHPAEVFVPSRMVFDEVEGAGLGGIEEGEGIVAQGG